MSIKSKKINVLFLLGSLNRGGTETLIADCFVNHKESGFNILGIYRSGGALEQTFINSGVDLFQLHPQNIFDIRYFFKLRKILKNNKINIIHAQQPLDGLYGFIAKLGLNIKLVLTFHGYDFNAGKLTTIINKLIIGLTDLNIYVSEHQKKYYLKKYKLEDDSGQQVVYNGVAFDKLKAEQGISIIKELKLSSSKYLLGSVGNFVAGRDSLTICKFLNVLNKKHIDFHFLFVGAKDESEPWRYDECVEFCKKNGLENAVHFLGSRSDVPSLLNQLDGFIYATDHDTFGIAVIEAIASEIPVFVNDWNVMLEVTQGGNLAEIYKTKNVEDLYLAFEKYMNNPEKYKQYAKQNAAAVKEKFSIQQHLKNLKTAYSSLLLKQ